MPTVKPELALLLVLLASMQTVSALTWSANSDWATGNFVNTSSMNGTLQVSKNFYREYEPANGTIAWWHFDDSGNEATDSSGNGNAARLGNSSAGTSPTWSTGRFGHGGLGFGGFQFANVSNPSSLNITSAITVEAWVNLDAIQNSVSGGDGDSYATVVSKDGSFYMRAYTNASGLQRVGFWVYVNNGTRIGASVTDDLRGTGWHMLAGTYDGTAVKFYMDGEPRATSWTAPGSIDATGNHLYIGSYNGTSEFFNGTMDEVRITNTTLADGDIDLDYAGFFRSAHYISNSTKFSVPIASVVAFFSKNEYNWNGTANMTNLTVRISADNGTVWRPVQSGVNVSTSGDNGTGLMFRVDFATTDTRWTASLPKMVLVPAFAQDLPPNVTLLSPQAGYSKADDVSVTFNCSAVDDIGLSAISLWHNMTGAWHQNATASTNGTSNRTSFSVNGTFGSFAWNCRATDAQGRSSFAPDNLTFSLTSTLVVLPSLSISFSPSSELTLEQGQTATLTANVINSGDALAGNVTLSFTESSCCAFSYSPNSSDVPALSSRDFEITVSALEGASPAQFSIVVTALSQEGAVSSGPLTISVTQKATPTPTPTPTGTPTPTPIPTPDSKKLAQDAISEADSTILSVDMTIADAEKEKKDVRSAVSKLATARGILRRAYSLMSGEVMDYEGALKAANDATALAKEALAAIPDKNKSPFADLWIIIPIVGIVAVIGFLVYTTFFAPKKKPLMPATYQPPQQQYYQYYKNYPYYYQQPLMAPQRQQPQQPTPTVAGPKGP